MLGDDKKTGLLLFLLLLPLLLPPSSSSPVPLSTCPLPSHPPPPLGHAMLPLFQMEPGYTNLNHGSYGSTPRAVTAVKRCWYDHIELVPDQWFRYDQYETMDLVRAPLAAFINAASKDDVAFVDNASHGMNAVLRSLAPLLQGTGKKIMFLDTVYVWVMDVCVCVCVCVCYAAVQCTARTRVRGCVGRMAVSVAVAVKVKVVVKVPGPVSCGLWLVAVNVAGPVSWQWQWQ